MARKVTRREVKSREKAKEKAKRRCKEQTAEVEGCSTELKPCKSEPSTDSRFVAVDETTASALRYAAEIAHMKAQQENWRKSHKTVAQAKLRPSGSNDVTGDLSLLSLTDQEMYFKPIPRRTTEPTRRVAESSAANRIIANSINVTLKDRIEEFRAKAKHFNEQVKVTASAFARANADANSPPVEPTRTQSTPSSPTFPYLQVNSKPLFEIARNTTEETLSFGKRHLQPGREVAIASKCSLLVRNIDPPIAPHSTPPLPPSDHYTDFYSLKPFSFNYIEIDAEPSLMPLTADTQFSASFATSTHIYLFYQTNRLCLGRFCAITHTWEPLRLQSHTTNVRPYFCSQLGTTRTVIVCCRTQLYSLDLDSLVLSPVSLPPETTIYPGFTTHSLPHADYPRFIYSSVALDHTRQHVYFYVRSQVTLTDFLGSLSVYRLDWISKLWTKVVNGKTLHLMGLSNDASTGGWKPACLAFSNGALYLVVKPFPSRLIRINPHTYDWIGFTLQSTAYSTSLDCQKCKWIQAGTSLYVVNSYNIDPSEQQEHAYDLWSFNLATFRLTCHQAATYFEAQPQHCSYLLCAKETKTSELWLLPKRYQHDALLAAFHIPLGIPSLHSLARRAFLLRAPFELEYSQKIIDSETTEYRRQPLTVAQITKYFQLRSPDILKAFKFPLASE